MLKKSKKPQLRRCTVCQRPGHNKNTCPEYLAIDNSGPKGNTVNFFVHHVSNQSLPSPHVIDLRKKKDNLWDNVTPISPEGKKDVYHYHHQMISAPAPVISEPEPILKKPEPEVKSETPVKIPAHVDQSGHPDCGRQGAKRPSETAGFRNWGSGWTKGVGVGWPKTQPEVKTEKVEIIEEKPSFFGELKHNLKEQLSDRFDLKILVAAIAVFIFLLIVPAKAENYYQSLKSTTNQVADSSKSGFLSLVDSATAILHANIPEAEASTDNAVQSFDTAVKNMEDNHQWLISLASVIPIVKDQVLSREKIVTAGQSLALGNSDVVKGIDESGNKDLADRIDILTKHLQSALPHYQSALSDLEQVKTEALPTEYQATFNDFRKLFGSIVGDFGNLANLGSTIKEIFGGQGLRRYLLVFQNPSELRPTGGFMGSFAMIEVDNGKIIKMDVPAGGSYDLKGQLNQYVEPPAPLLLTDKRWEFQDANWYPDFPASAQNILWFYRHSRNISADGVIAINASVLQRILSITGPITDSKRDITLSSVNALPLIQDIVEHGPEKKDFKPKQILADLAPQFIEYFKNLQSENLMPVLTNLEEALDQKEIQVYLSDDPSEANIQNLGWGGQIANTTEGQDYINVVNTNIQGQKSDARIEQTISHQAIIDENGSIVDTVTITRKHTGDPMEKMYGAANIDYLRLYVPEGSELLSAEGFTWPPESKFQVPESWYKKDVQLASVEQEVKLDNQSGTRIVNEFGKTSFGNWVITTPGTTSQVQFVYRLPFKISTNKIGDTWTNLLIPEKETASYQLVAQRQSGCDTTFESQTIFPPSWQPSWKKGDNITLALNGAAISPFILNKDMMWSLVMEKE